MQVEAETIKADLLDGILTKLLRCSSTSTKPLSLKSAPVYILDAAPNLFRADPEAAALKEN
jgi:hypothetical protein